MTTAPALDPRTAARDQRGADEWRRLGHRLWAGRRDGRPIGTIERGYRYTLVDEDGRVRGTFRTLDAAQVGATERSLSTPQPAPAAEQGWERRTRDEQTGRFGVLAAVTSVAGMVAVALSVSGVLTLI